MESNEGRSTAKICVLTGVSSKWRRRRIPLHPVKHIGCPNDLIDEEGEKN
jgi:hypothetical protein